MQKSRPCKFWEYIFKFVDIAHQVQKSPASEPQILSSSSLPRPALPACLRVICYANLFSITCYQRFASDYANVSNLRRIHTHRHRDLHALQLVGKRGACLALICALQVAYYC